jgi:excisionase family DNA binding protein
MTFSLSVRSYPFAPIIGNWPDREWFSVPLLAGKWSIPSRKLHRQIEAGRLRAYRFGRHYRVTIESAKQFEDAYIATQ